MLQEFQPGDVLVFQLESGYGVLRVLAVDEASGDLIWHVAAYNELFLDVEGLEAALKNSQSLSVSVRHIALTNRAFESTQVARITNIPLGDDDLAPLSEWRNDSKSKVSDRSIRLMLGLR